MLLVLNLVLLPAGAALSAWSMTIIAGMDPSSGKALAHPAELPASLMWSSVGGFTVTCMIVTGILGVMTVTGEYTTRTVQMSFVADPHRVLFMNAKAVVVAALSFLSAMAGLLLSWGAAYALFATSAGGMGALGDSERLLPWVTVVGGACVLAVTAVMALGLGGLCRSTVGGVFALIGIVMIAPSVLSLVSLAGDRFAWIGSVAACLPSQAATTFLTGGVDVTEATLTLMGGGVGGGAGAAGAGAAAGDAGVAAAGAGSGAGSGSGSAAADAVASAAASGGFNPTWWQAGLILLAWAVVLYVIGVLVVRRADVK
ncbi:hypothetical protein JS531_07230 [Bifidobacterium sp. CP2]|uniref:hypothetical protein n=1 Tax=Bifidobacterium sp. CP2 TaxID=2809025 RepID=UPI001BDBC303|nr:hypothetical protein [Bifidobacterium sp. CP2]MBT1181750.1 hypothetical protein [Bifidobacterium sp. CP2]